MGISSAFVARVTAEDGMDTHAQQLLAAAIQLQRAPNRCVAFDACPVGVTAAHNCTMKVRPAQHQAEVSHADDVACNRADSLGLALHTP